MKTINHTTAIVGIAFILGLAQVGAQAWDNTNRPSAARPERPEKPKKDKEDEPERPNITDVDDVVKSFKEEKEKFIKQQKELRKGASEDIRKQRRDELLQEINSTPAAVRKDAKEAVEAAKRLAQEQARKLAEEATEAAKKKRKD